MKHLFTLALITLLLSQDKFQVYNSEKFNYSIQYPSDWIIKEFKGRDLFVHESFTDEYDVKANLEVIIKDFYEISADIYLELYEHEISEDKLIPDYERTNTRSKKINGSNCYIIEAKGTISEVKLKWIKTFLVHNNLFYSVTISDEEESFKTNKSVYEQLIDTFEINK